MATKQLHVAMLASPGVGHLLPILLLSHRLATHHNLRVTVLAVTATATIPQYLSQLITSFTTHLSVIQIPAADISAVAPRNANVVTQLCVMMRETIPAIRATISAMNSRPHVFVGDIFSNESWAVAEELGIPKYVFVTGNAWFTALFTYSPVLDKQVVGQYVDQKEPLEIPGCRPVRPDEIFDAMLNRDDENYDVYLNLAVGVTLADGMLINTWEDLEPQTLNALRTNEILRSVVKYKPVYTVGPVNKRYEPDALKGEVVEWLDKQPERSVIYVSFGSEGTISAEQINELAWGLELSRQRFVWVVRPPTGHVPDGSFFKAGQSDATCDYLPEGFLTRTQKVGLVVSSWAPQVEILNHTSVAGFLTHCGWNSTLESVTNGVPMIAWPLYAEQKMNAAMLTEELKVAVRPEVLPTKKVVGREDVARMVMDLVEGEEVKVMKINVDMLKKGAEKAIRENGSSYISVCKFIEDCWSQIQ
ncbi:putative anthocyanidin 3-O-glucosyltransferase [Helianthus annuus]|uniref:Glycosyltransferase n=1 Tax=Helianthus annuus TaxID=4232 RepID=A0A9K3ILN6_HELAN|nr:anthocyanidin 3-O-glucosyltransferase 5 [Helianthus annuus]KAF5798685.1 putative anthocyanidin 3-O-glucosyltransferase [Helianthus annuus]KAJ0550259.1 putative anthocyanidin 3-O-glucosyltransferase [Helianthus annuus]KAJ0556929.1 putative anthocyanidin 3-O-glucosyltransferase [Helianthus annuus]KAJ0563211.1 putative anthocyanidin 3-O-glucosyltransferase [Helianthus annuus]KAJ0731321.1 putative anthocyanidin 3-O-glucosyltransferase [Helianthus annuus]